MGPDLEVIRIGRAQSFKAWEHGYPFHTVRWHFHPECELHYVVATEGHYFVGDFIGAFAPGNLVLTGPNLPHNWVSDVGPGDLVPLRSRVVQFTEEFIETAMTLMPELAPFGVTLRRSRRGLLFGPATAARIAPRLAELVVAEGPRKVELFMGVVGALARADDAGELASPAYGPDPSGFMSAGINDALAFINDNLTERFDETDLARIARLSTGAFSRAFRRHTGLPLVAYVNRLRIDLACQLLIGTDSPRVAEVCFASGFNNLSNFNRQFLKHKGMTPSEFRALAAANFRTGLSVAA